MRGITGFLYFLILLTPSLWAGAAVTEETYLKTDDYITAALGQKPEKPGTLWVTGDMRPTVEQILDRKTFPLRYRYWRNGNRTVWILNEIGKVLPITTGITVENEKIINLTVLTYRESHGSEIRFPAYSNQFNDVTLKDNLRLSKPINGISGATLSTNAMKKVSRLALYLHHKLMEENGSTPAK
ncbi:FMN-binding protein [Paremcibacter congregatus]|uniref:FMN-binding protein n=1 Tax=Paremcibacter congregatus TaxID=2043170 RepID=UPI0030ED3BB3|tara:strand:- start:7549 stop:8100 length:552 start_codon:yes stop_codon:yes gene_type:complete